MGPVEIDEFRIWHWKYEVEQGLVMHVTFEEDAPEEGVVITIKDRTIKLWEDEVAPLIDILTRVRAKHDAFVSLEYKK